MGVFRVLGVISLFIGLSLAYSTTQDPACGWSIYELPAEIDYPARGGNYGLNEYCEWTITNDNPGPIQLIFEMISIEGDHGNCAYDKLEVYDDNSLVETVCGFDLIPEIVSISSTMRLVFSSDSSKSYEGFRANFTSLYVADTTQAPSQAPTQPQADTTQASSQPQADPTQAQTQPQGDPTQAPPQAPTQPQGDPTQAPTQPQGGAVYTRWGRRSCPRDAERVYNGFAATGSPANYGGGRNFLCLPADPEWSHDDEIAHSERGNLYGVQYEGYPDNYFEKNNTARLQNEDVPCAVCYVGTRSSSMMIPGRMSCSGDWTLEYNGLLMSGYYASTDPTTFECVDRAPEVMIGGSADHNGARMVLVESRCDPLSCTPYTDHREVACVVCTR